MIRFLLAFLLLSLSGILAEESGFIRWKADNDDIEFVKITNDLWIEYHNQEEFARFKFISQNNDQVILLDESRNLTIKLDSISAKWGSDLNSISNQIYTGQWISSPYTVWSASDEDKQFIQKSDTIWIERQTGSSFAEFKFVSRDGDQVILFAEDRNFYVSLDSDSADWGYSLDSISNRLNDGKWIQ